MKGLNDFEMALLDKLLAGDHPVLCVLRKQANKGRLVSREYTGAGFFCIFEVPTDVPSAIAGSDFHFGDVNACIDGLQHGAGFVVFVRNGRLHMLEGYSFDEPWPQALNSFVLSYQIEPRNLKLPDPHK